MSDHLLRLVPKAVAFQPEPTSARRAEALLRAFFPQAQRIQSRYHAAVSFIDAGENWEGVHCPVCAADAEAWWGEAMSACSAQGFTSLSTQAPCCGASVRLNEMNYIWPVAFARFALEVLNPNISSVSAEQLAQISALLGTEVKAIHALI